MNKLLQLIIFTILICPFSSCKSSKVDHTSLSKEELVYQAVINYEMRELGTTFLVVDKSKGNCTSENVDTNIHFKSNNMQVSWNKTLFKNLNYLNGDVVYNYLNTNPDKYKELRSKHGENGWLELSSPCFSANDEFALIKVDFGKNMAFNNSNHYLLKKTNKAYKITKTISD